MSEDLKTAVATFNEFAKDARLVAADAKTLTGKFSSTKPVSTRGATTKLEIRVSWGYRRF